jgi:hypothetical protein
MSKGGGDAPSPDPNIGIAAKMQAKTGEEWLGFAKDQFKVSNARQKGVDALAAKVQGTQLGLMQDQAKWGRADRSRYEKEFVPVERDYIQKAKGWGSEAGQSEAAAEAGADVQTAAAASRETARREAESVGITPGSGRYAGIDRAGELGTALATAGAKNTARNQRRTQGMALEADVANMGRGLPAQAAAGAAGATNAGTSAYGIAGANQQLSMMPGQQMAQGFGGQMQGYAGQANTLSNLYGLQLQKYQIDQEAKSAGISGIFNALGTGIGAFAALSDPKLKTNVKAVKKGDGLKAVKKMPVKKFDYKPGQGDGGKGHIGTMSDSFAKATGGPDTGMIKFQDAIGISMKAIQDLDAKVDKIGKAVGLSPPKPRRSSQSPAKARAGGSKPAAKAKRATLRGPDIKPAKVGAIGIGRG